MTAMISPRISRLLAVTLLLFAAWLAINVSYFAISRRLDLRKDISDLRQRYEELRNRRVDIRSLQDQLATLITSVDIRNAAIMANSDRAAAVRLQQIVRKSVEDVEGKLLSLVELGVDRSASLVKVQVRARIGEPSLAQWISLLENGEPHLHFDELAVASRPQPSETVLQLEITATLRVRWLAIEGSGQ